jgi:hypothetical protein
MAVDPETDEVTLMPNSGAAIGTKIIVPPSLGDIDGNGTLEVVAAVNEEYVEPPNAVFENPVIQLFQAVGVLDSGNTRVYALYADGAMHGPNGVERGWNPDAFLPGWPVKTALLTTELLPTVGTGSNGPPALADVTATARSRSAPCRRSARRTSSGTTACRSSAVIRPARIARWRPRPSAPAATRTTRRASAASVR